MPTVDVAANVRRVLDRIAAAARRAGRDPDSVRLVAASKTKPAEMIEAAIAAGVRLVGENYVQEARAKRDAVRGAAEWHLIGHLQRNKARAAAALFEVVQTLDDMALARALDRLGAERGEPVRVFVEVNTGGEASKRGLPPAEVPGFVAALAVLANLRLEGLMTIPPPAAEQQTRGYFRLLRRLRDDLGLGELSMGMTDDFELAVEEGATVVRVGRAIFGERT